ncbi:hypothetical protein AB204_20600, partial [Xenorhabdus khoisanae]
MADSLNDASRVELKIEAASGTQTPSIYANGNNQLAVVVTAKAYKGITDEILDITDREWQESLSLCHAETNEQLTNGWTYSTKANEYTREIPSVSLKKLDMSEYTRNTRNLILFYVSTKDVNIKRIAVRCDVNNKMIATTADNAS